MVEFIFPKDLMRIFPIRTYKGAWKRFSRMKKRLDKKKGQCITVNEFAEFEGLDINFIKQKMNIK